MKEKKIFKEIWSYASDYIDSSYDRNVFPTDEALKNLSHFDEELPEETGDASEILKSLNTYGSPATMSQIAGRYFGFVNGSSVPAGMAAKCLGTIWDQNTAMQIISPLCAKLESVVQSWLVSLFDFPQETVAGFVSGTSAANLAGLAAARYRLLQNLNWDVNDKGLFGAPPLRLISGADIHSSAEKALSVLGLGKGNLELVPVDKQGRLVAEQMPDLDETCIVILQAGNVNSGAFDPFEEVCKKANEAGAWVHIDGAFGLWAGAVDKFQDLTRGLELADSWAVDGHKTLNTPYDCGIVMCKDGDALSSALHMSGGYLVLSEDRDGMFFTPEMSRRSRILELWATMRYLGRDGIAGMVYGFHERAKQFAEMISRHGGFEVMNDVVFNQVLVQCENDQLTDEVIEKIQQLRTCWVGGSWWKGRRVIRVSVCSWATTERDIDLSVQSFVKALSIIQNMEE